MKEYLSSIKSSPLFSSIEDDDILSMLKCLDVKISSYPKDSIIIHRGDTVSSIGLILKGSAFITQEDIWGNRNIIQRIKEGETFGTAYASTNGTALNVSVTAETDVSVMYLSIKRVLTMCPSACTFHTLLIRNIMMETAEKNLKVSEKITHLSQRTTRAKILSYLSSEAQHRGSLEFDIPFSRQEMADYLSVERSGLSIELGKLKKEGVIDYEKNHFSIKVKEDES